MAIDEMNRDEISEGARQVIENLIQRVYDWLLSFNEQAVDWIVDHMPNWLIKLLSAFIDRQDDSRKANNYAMQ